MITGGLGEQIAALLQRGQKLSQRRPVHDDQVVHHVAQRSADGLVGDDDVDAAAVLHLGEHLADVAAENAGSCGVMRALGFTPTENGTFRRSGSQTEYKNLTFKKEL